MPCPEGGPAAVDAPLARVLGGGTLGESDGGIPLTALISNREETCACEVLGVCSAECEACVACDACPREQYNQ